VAVGAAAGWPESAGIGGAYVLTAVVAVAAAVLARRVPSRTLPAPSGAS
jgi:hypothetical protein